MGKNKECKRGKMRMHPIPIRAGAETKTENYDEEQPAQNITIIVSIKHRHC